MFQFNKILIFFFIGLSFSGILYLISKLTTLKIAHNFQKNSEYECGFESFDNATRRPFDIHFYLVGILFVLFDVELTMLFPWVLNYFSLSWTAFLTGFFFVFFIIYGIVYEWWMGISNWSKKTNNNDLLKGLLKKMIAPFKKLSTKRHTRDLIKKLFFPEFYEKPGNQWSEEKLKKLKDIYEELKQFLKKKLSNKQEQPSEEKLPEDNKKPSKKEETSSNKKEQSFEKKLPENNKELAKNGSPAKDNKNESKTIDEKDLRKAFAATFKKKNTSLKKEEISSKENNDAEKNYNNPFYENLKKDKDGYFTTRSGMLVKFKPLKPFKNEEISSKENNDSEKNYKKSFEKKLSEDNKKPSKKEETSSNKKEQSFEKKLPKDNKESFNKPMNLNQKGIRHKKIKEIFPTLVNTPINQWSFKDWTKLNEICDFVFKHRDLIIKKNPFYKNKKNESKSDKGPKGNTEYSNNPMDLNQKGIRHEIKKEIFPHLVNTPENQWSFKDLTKLNEICDFVFKHQDLIIKKKPPHKNKKNESKSDKWPEKKLSNKKDQSSEKKLPEENKKPSKKEETLSKDSSSNKKEQPSEEKLLDDNKKPSKKKEQSSEENNESAKNEKKTFDKNGSSTKDTKNESKKTNNNALFKTWRLLFLTTAKSFGKTLQYIEQLINNQLMWIISIGYIWISQKITPISLINKGFFFESSETPEEKLPKFNDTYEEWKQNLEKKLSNEKEQSSEKKLPEENKKPSKKEEEISTELLNKTEPHGLIVTGLPVSEQIKMPLQEDQLNFIMDMLNFIPAFRNIIKKSFFPELYKTPENAWPEEKLKELNDSCDAWEKKTWPYTENLSNRKKLFQMFVKQLSKNQLLFILNTALKYMPENLTRDQIKKGFFPKLYKIPENAWSEEKLKELNVICEERELDLKNNSSNKKEQLTKFVEQSAAQLLFCIVETVYGYLPEIFFFEDLLVRLFYNEYSDTPVNKWPKEKLKEWNDMCDEYNRRYFLIKNEKSSEEKFAEDKNKSLKNEKTPSEKNEPSTKDTKNESKSDKGPKGKDIFLLLLEKKSFFDNSNYFFYFLDNCNGLLLFNLISLLIFVNLIKNSNYISILKIKLLNKICLFVLCIEIALKTGVNAKKKKVFFWFFKFKNLICKTMQKKKLLIFIIIIFFCCCFFISLILFKLDYQNAIKLITTTTVLLFLKTLFNFLIQSINFLFFFIIFLSINLIIYCLIHLNKKNNSNAEPLIKYFYLSTLTTIWIAYICWLFLELCINENYFWINFLNFLTSCLAILQSCVYTVVIILFIALFFKLAAFPCHFLTPELYKSIKYNIIYILAIPVKIVFFLLLLNWVKNLFFVLRNVCGYILWFSAVFSTSLGVLGALYDRAWKSFYAYSSTNQMGFILSSLNSIYHKGTINLILYLFIYSTNSVLLLKTLFTYCKETLNFLYTDQLRFFYNYDILFFLALPSALFSFAGIPTLSGFFSKYEILLELVNCDKYFLMFICLITSLISSFYYISIIKKSFFLDKNKIGFYFIVFKKRLKLIIISLIVINFFWCAFHKNYLLYLERLSRY